MKYILGIVGGFLIGCTLCMINYFDTFLRIGQKQAGLIESIMANSALNNYGLAGAIIGAIIVASTSMSSNSK